MEKEYIQLPALKRDLDPDVVKALWRRGSLMVLIPAPGGHKTTGNFPSFFG